MIRYFFMTNKKHEVSSDTTIPLPCDKCYTDAAQPCNMEFSWLKKSFKYIWTLHQTASARDISVLIAMSREWIGAE